MRIQTECVTCSQTFWSHVDDEGELRRTCPVCVRHLASWEVEVTDTCDRCGNERIDFMGLRRYYQATERYCGVCAYELGVFAWDED